MGRIVRIKNLEIGQGHPKICGLVIGEKEEEILELAEKSNETICDLVEFRADHYNDILDIEKTKLLIRKIRKIVKKPMIFTFRRFEEGGKVKITLDYYKHLLNSVADENLAEIIDVEYTAIENDDSLVEQLKEKGAYIIVSLHDLLKTPSQEEIIKIFFEMEKKGADIIKAAFMPNSKKDVLALISAAEQKAGLYSGCPVIAISLGHLGLITRIFGDFFDSAIYFASITKASAPGQVNIDSLDTVLKVIYENFKRVFLMGFMGSGKTAVANVLANKYGLSKIDLDAYIEQKENQSISDIFSKHSESFFRDKETKYLKKVIQKDYQVVSLGGGTVLREENVKVIKENGKIIFLTATPETIISRIKNDRSRPLLVGNNMDLEYIRSLMDKRQEVYNNAADVVICTDDKTPEEIAEEIIGLLGFKM